MNLNFVKRMILEKNVFLQEYPTKNPILLIFLSINFHFSIHKKKNIQKTFSPQNPKFQSTPPTINPATHFSPAPKRPIAQRAHGFRLSA